MRCEAKRMNDPGSIEYFGQILQLSSHLKAAIQGQCRRGIVDYVVVDKDVYLACKAEGLIVDTRNSKIVMPLLYEPQKRVFYCDKFLENPMVSNEYICFNYQKMRLVGDVFFGV